MLGAFGARRSPCCNLSLRRLWQADHQGGSKFIDYALHFGFGLRNLDRVVHGLDVSYIPFDESGFTGTNLLDGTQSIFAIASTMIATEAGQIFSVTMRFGNGLSVIIFQNKNSPLEMELSCSIRCSL